MTAEFQLGYRAGLLKCLEILNTLPAQGLYRLGGGYHTPSYDDAWRLARSYIKQEYLNANVPSKS